MAAAKKGLTLTSSARIGGRIASEAAAKNVPRQLVPNGAKKFDFQTAILDHNREMWNIAHEHTMKVIRLQGASDVAKAKLRGMRAHMRAKLLDCQISVMQNCMAAFGNPVFAWVIVHDVVSYSQKPSVCVSED